MTQPNVTESGIDSISGLCKRHFRSASRTVKIGRTALLLVTIGALADCHRTQHLHNTAYDHKPQLAASAVPGEDATGLDGDPSTDVHAVLNYRNTAASMLQARKFDALDCLADHARLRKERFAGGTWKLHELYQGLSRPVQVPVHASTEDWDTLVKQLQAWLIARPKSVTARVALAEAYIGYAAEDRGDGDPNTVSEGGWKLIRERTAQAEQILGRISTHGRKDPESYVVMLEIAWNQNWSEAKKQALFHKAMKADPDYYYDAQVVATNLLPKRGGKPGDTERFMSGVADRVGGEQGDILYFQIATIPRLICTCSDDAHLSLPRIEKGFEAAERQYGSSLLNLNRVAYLTVRSRPDDEIFADKAFTRIGDQWDEETWGGWQDDFVKAKNFAAFMGERLRIEAAADANMKTPEGAHYRVDFEKPYRELAQRCAQPGDGDLGKFKALTDVGAKGTIEDVRIYGSNPAAWCLYEKLHAMQLEKATPFPAPPWGGYWVRLDLDWAEFAPVAAK